MVEEPPKKKISNYEIVNHHKKLANMRNIKGLDKPTKETFEIQEAEVEEIEIFRAIAQEYFIDDSDEEVDTIPWDLSTEESKWKYDEDTKNTDENTEQEYA
ncbi:9065_t:CDS:1 [Dentiscutata erythropus]|uniref:9065_t:CDS:1 n=1 Tax=Dentiscutata erythropus TaxID=1348616 RepID=A0A9N9EPU3_9GLOM|nr:9065_t:CDS:1 [Dentiscutata erythropus]